MPVGHIGGTLRVFVVHFNGDEPVLLAGADTNVLGQLFACIDTEFFAVDLHQVELLNDSVGHRRALHQRNILVGRALDARCRAGQARKRPQRSQRVGGQALLLLRR